MTPTAKKVSGEGHWQPAARQGGRLIVLDSKKFLTPGQAIAEAKRIVAERLAERRLK